MSLRKTFVFAILLAGILLFILKVEIPREAAQAKEGLVFDGVKREEIASIEIVTRTESFVLENRNTSTAKTAAESSSTEPVVVDNNLWQKWGIGGLSGSQLDQSRLLALLSALASFKLEGALPSEDVAGDLGVFGLDSPELTVRVKHGERLVDLQFGKENSYVQKRYAKLAGESTVYLVSSALYSEANKPRNEFRNSLPLTFTDSDVNRITLKGSSSMTLTSNEKFEWRIVEPALYTASDMALSSLTRDIRAFKAKAFHDNASSTPEKFGLKKPAFVGTLGFRDSVKRAELEFSLGRAGTKGSEATYLVVKGDPTVYELTEDVLPRVSRTIDDLREKQLFRFATDQVVQADFEIYKASPVSLVKEPTQWRVNGKLGDDAFVNALIKELAELRADGFPDDNRDYGFANPRFKALVRTVGPPPQKEARDRILVVGDVANRSKKEGESRYYAAVDDLKEPFIISQESYQKLLPREEVLVKVEPTPAATVVPEGKK